MSQREGRPVIDFDHHSGEFGQRSTEILREHRGRCPIGFSQQYDGFWAVFSHALGMAVFRDYDHFSTSKFRDEDGQLRGGLTVPTLPALDLIPNELDPPVWNAYRRLLNPVFSPAAVERLRPRIELLTDQLIDEFIEAGEADLVLDLANLGPALVTIDFLGLERDDLTLFSDPFHKAVWAPAGSPEWHEALDGFARMPPTLMKAIEARRAQPQDDYISELVRMEIDGERLDDASLVKILMQLLAGGVDSTAALLANVFVYLDEHPEARPPLLDDEQVLQRATEEFVRFFTPIQALARSATGDVEVGGQCIRAREPVLISMASMNRDDAVFDNPDEVVLDRWPNRHVGFGLGMHRCLGSNFARAMFQSVLTRVLQRLPDYRVDRSAAIPYASMSTINGWVEIPVTFTTGLRVAGRTEERHASPS